MVRCARAALLRRAALRCAVLLRCSAELLGAGVID